MKQEELQKLAEANMNLQTETRTDIIRGLDRLLYLTGANIKKAFEIINNKKKLDNNVRDGDKDTIYATISLTKQEFNEMFYILREFSDGGRVSEGTDKYYVDTRGEVEYNKELLKKLEK